MTTPPAPWLLCTSRLEPATRTVHVYRAPHGLQAFGEEDELSGGDGLPGFR